MTENLCSSHGKVNFVTLLVSSMLTTSEMSKANGVDCCILRHLEFDLDRTDHLVNRTMKNLDTYECKQLD